MLHGSNVLRLLRRLTVFISAFLCLCITSSYGKSSDVEMLITVPDRCIALEKQTETQIFLKTVPECKFPMLKVKVPENTEYVDIYLDGVFYKRQPVKDKNLEESIKRLTENQPKVDAKLPDNPEAKKMAEESFKYSQSEEFKTRVAEFKTELEKMLRGGEQSSGQKFGFYSKLETAQKGLLSQDERIYIFVSSSMPEETVKNYVKALARINSPEQSFLVLRGGIGGLKYVMPTVQWTFNLLKKNPYCSGEDCELYRVRFVIDPFLFRKYSIDRVPAVVYVKGLVNEEGLSEGLSGVKVSDYWVSYGDVSLAYHLKLIAGRSKDERLKKISEMLE